MLRSPSALVRLLVGGTLLIGSYLLAGVASAAESVKTGTETLSLTDGRGRPMPTEIWYPAATSATEAGFAAQPFFQPILLAREAEYCCEAANPRPLVILSHGIFGGRFSQGWLARELVSHGYIVASITHLGTTAADITPVGIYRLGDRAESVTIALDHLLRHPKWGRYIDGRRVAFVGHSFGGGTGVLLAGGSYDAKALVGFCKTEAARRDTYCEPLAKLDPQGLDLEQTRSSYRDARIRAFYIMGSAPAQGFIRESLRAIRAPFFVDTAARDEILDNDLNAHVFAREIAGTEVVERPVGHFAYVPLCIAGPLPPQAAPICQDPPGVARGAAHAAVADAVLQFLQKHL